MESSSAPRAEPEAELISIDTFGQIDLRVGQVVRAERVPNADKLLRLEVDLAEPEPRQLLAGIAEWYAPEGLVGQKILVVARGRLHPQKDWRFGRGLGLQPRSHLAGMHGIDTAVAFGRQQECRRVP